MWKHAKEFGDEKEYTDDHTLIQHIMALSLENSALI